MWLRKNESIACCCTILQGINKFGYNNCLVTSNYIAWADPEKCTGCGKCARACPINAINMAPAPAAAGQIKSRQNAGVDSAICLGCGVCATKCKFGALQLKKRKQQVIHPETTFERIILQSLERGNLQNYIFDNPEAISHRVMRGVLGGFLRLLPVNKAIILHWQFLGELFVALVKKMTKKQRFEVRLDPMRLRNTNKLTIRLLRLSIRQ